MDPAVVHLLRDIDLAYDKRSWHGTNLRGSLRGLTSAEAAWRPGPARHNIWEIAVHCAYWKYAVWRRLRGERRGSFPSDGSDWFLRPSDAAASDKAWKADVALLSEMHTRLREAVAGLGAKDLSAPAKGSKVSNLEIIAGIAAHDLYHAGQVQLLKRLRA